MSNEQWALLAEYDNWKTVKENVTVDLSIDAFRKEWEAKFDRERIEEVIVLLHKVNGGALAPVASSILAILTGDRPVVDNA